VLLAEDNAVNQRVVVRLLEKFGHAVVVTGDGRQALAAFDREAFDLVLMDVSMPELDGFEATQAIREREAGSGRRTPVVAMTAHAMKGDRERCLAAGMDDHLAKPLMPADLAAALERWARPHGGVRDQIEQRLDLLRGAGAALGPAELAGLLRRLSAHAPGHVEQIMQAVALEDPARLRAEAHQLKGVAANLGARDLAELCETLERVDLSAVIEPLAELRPRTREMLDAVDEILAGLRSAAVR
jgi:CheY-like chemotaxis protein/HPt (histidine-containing phosphotransfer) domain-containing protein